MNKVESPDRRLRAFVRKHKTASAAARALGISQPYLSQLLRGVRAFSPAVLDKLGLEFVPPMIRKKRNTKIVRASGG